jgi:hypothetical protein
MTNVLHHKSIQRAKNGHRATIKCSSQLAVMF